jgi:hypothetical protein
MSTPPPPPLELSPFSHALSVLAAGDYLQLEPEVHARCRPVAVRPTSAPSLADPFLCLHHSTWRPRGSYFFTLIKTPLDTIVFSHETDRAYVAAPCAKLGSGCPPHTALLGQWCLDRGAAGALIPRLLVFDLLDADPSPAGRGERLRALAPFLPQPLCTVQWAGHAAALDRFARTLPHEVECYLHLSADPLRPERHLSVALPPSLFSRADVAALGEAPDE